MKLAHKMLTDCAIQAETEATALENASETMMDSLLIAILLEGLPDMARQIGQIKVHDL